MNSLKLFSLDKLNGNTYMNVFNLQEKKQKPHPKKSGFRSVFQTQGKQAIQISAMHA